MRREIELKAGEVLGPFDLDKTIQSGQTSECAWKRIKERYWDAELINGEYIKYEVFQDSKVDKGALKLIVYSEEFSDELIKKIKSYFIRIFRLNDDLEVFYDKFKFDELSKTFSVCRGLRLMRASNLFESLICSISSQHASIKQWNHMIDLIKMNFGEKIKFDDGSVFYAFPTPEALKKASIDKLKNLCLTGYRAGYIQMAAKKVSEGFIDFNELKKLKLEDAKEKLVELPGVGPKVANCFLLYGLGRTEAVPVDVWIHRIVSKLYFSDRKISKDEAEEYLRSKYKEWAGYAQLYLFDFARSSLKFIQL
ncbi:MAG: 3-methyladenine DNA glycosylase [Candidatus Bathyarchaeia archaeon]